MYDYDEMEVRVAEAFFVPLNLTALYDEAVREFGRILARNLKGVQGHDRLPRDVAKEIKNVVIDYLQQDMYDEEELTELVAKKLHSAGVPRATQVAEMTISEFLRKLKELLRREEEKAKKKRRELE